MPQLTAAEIYAHPEYGKVPWEGKPTQEGSVDVAKGRGGPVSIAYEIHGTGPHKLVVSEKIKVNSSSTFLTTTTSTTTTKKRGEKRGIFSASSRVSLL
jgi:hypothetical protein